MFLYLCMTCMTFTFPCWCGTSTETAAMLPCGSFYIYCLKSNYNSFLYTCQQEISNELVARMMRDWLTESLDIERQDEESAANLSMLSLMMDSVSVRDMTSASSSLSVPFIMVRKTAVDTVSSLQAAVVTISW